MTIKLKDWVQTPAGPGQVVKPPYKRAEDKAIKYVDVILLTAKLGQPNGVQAFEANTVKPL
jgi:hypothetical protein